MEQPSSAAAMPEPVLQQELAPPSEGAGFWIRAAARIIDTVVLMVGGAFMGAAWAVTYVVMHGPGATVPTSTIPTFFAGIISTLAFHTIAESVAGGTPGKLLLGLRVITQDGKRAGFTKTLVRSLAYWVDAFFFAIPAYNSMQRSGAQNLRYGDRWAKTMVVKRADFDARVSLGIGAMFLGIVVATVVKLAIDLCALAL